MWPSVISAELGYCAMVVYLAVFSRTLPSPPPALPTPPPHPTYRLNFRARWFIFVYRCPVTNFRNFSVNQSWVCLALNNFSTSEVYFAPGYIRMQFSQPCVLAGERHAIETRLGFVSTLRHHCQTLSFVRKREICEFLKFVETKLAKFIVDRLKQPPSFEASTLTCSKISWVWAKLEKFSSSFWNIISSFCSFLFFFL